MNLQYYKDPWRLVNDGDVHELGDEFDQALIYLSIAILKYENNMDEGDKFAVLYKDELRVLRRTNVDKLDWLPRLLRPRDNIFPANLPGPHRFLAYQQVGADFGPIVS